MMDASDIFGTCSSDEEGDVYRSPVAAQSGRHGKSVQVDASCEMYKDSLTRMIFGSCSSAGTPPPPVKQELLASATPIAWRSAALSADATAAPATVDAASILEVMEEVDDEPLSDDGTFDEDRNGDFEEDSDDNMSDDGMSGADRACALTPSGTSSSAFSHTSGCQSCSGTMAVQSSEAVKSTASGTALVPASRGALTEQFRLHYSGAKTCFNGWECRCQIAFARGSQSCLTEFKVSFLKELSALAYPDEKVKARDVKLHIHRLIWELKVRQAPDAYKRVYSVPEWKLDTVPVCKRAWQVATGGTHHAHREALTLTLLGTRPEGAAAAKKAVLCARQLNRTGSHRQEWAVSWWKRHLMWHDWLPNEVAIQYRGPQWKIVHHQYAAEALHANKDLKIRSFMRARGPALAQLKAEFFPHETCALRCVRSARHSNFPECNDCQFLRDEYQNLAKLIGADRELLQEKYQALLDHAKDWQEDRALALDLRQLSENSRATSRYHVDDKCGSFWEKLPVNESGRETKEDKTARYGFSIHANVCCGDQGVTRFTMVPKNLKCGSDFGLTNLLVSLMAAKTAGHLPPHVEHLYRHTDGGPDNVAWVVHLIHWLLVYLGVFQTITWFRFKAGHSHTEVADRLFSILKKFFVTDSAARVLGIESVPDLVALLQEEFKDIRETFQFAWNFANWDFTRWAEDQKLFGTLKYVKQVRVWRYNYDITNWQHGGVTVQRKEKLAWKGTSREAEWSPIQRETHLRPNADGEMEEMPVNVSQPGGHRFVLRPPDMRKEPPREPLATEDDASKLKDPASVIERLLKVRGGSLSQKACSFWKVLQKLHGTRGMQAESLPQLPFTSVAEDGYSYTFHGAPQALKPLLSQLAFRFPRPLVPEDPFNTAPHETFQAAYEAFQQGSMNAEPAEPSQADAASSSDRLRDPRVENIVVDEDHTDADRRKEMAEAEQETFHEDVAARVEKVEVGELYLLELQDAENGLRLGLGLVTCNVRGKENQWTIAWFKMATKKGWQAQNPAFEPYFVNKKIETEDFDIECFRLQVPRYTHIHLHIHVY